jgi:predicted nucleic acid-binding protein
MKRIADTGLLKALLDRSDIHHSWGHEQFRAHAPFHTCEAVLDELAHLTQDPRLGLKLVSRGDLVLEFSLEENAAPVLGLLEKYADRSMDLADACIVRMAELSDACKVWTVDREDFAVYRRHSRQVVPCVFP